MIGIKIVVTWHKNNTMFLTPDNVVKFTNLQKNKYFYKVHIMTYVYNKFI